MRPAVGPYSGVMWELAWLPARERSIDEMVSGMGGWKDDEVEFWASRVRVELERRGTVVLELDVVHDRE